LTAQIHSLTAENLTKESMILQLEAGVPLKESKILQKEAIKISYNPVG